MKNELEKKGKDTIRKLISERKELVLMLTLHVGKILSYIMPVEDVFKEYSTTPSKSKNLIQYLIVQVAVVQVVVVQVAVVQVAVVQGAAVQVVVAVLIMIRELASLTFYFYLHPIIDISIFLFN